MTETFSIPWPPSVNRYWRNVRGRVVKSKEARDYHKTVRFAIGKIGRPRTDRLALIICASPPDRRRRDLDNLLKAILDALTTVGLWVDDEQIDDLRIMRFSPETGGRIYLTMRKVE